MPNYIVKNQFRNVADIRKLLAGGFFEVNQFTYKFENYFHPFVGELISQLNTSPTIAGLFDPGFLQGLTTDFFMAPQAKNPNYTAVTIPFLVALDYFPKTIDVSTGGPYANYNWELFYHIPVMVAVHLSKNQRFAEAQKWFHLVFNPMSTDLGTPAPERYWNFLAFRQETGVQNIDQLLTLLSTPDSELSSDQQQAKQNVLHGYNAICNSPFNPHPVAATRPVAYQYYVVMKYFDNLIAWGDSLFLQDTIETVNEATLCYVLAANLLGPTPQQMPPRGTVGDKNFYQLTQAGLDPMGNAMVELESQFPFNITLPGQNGGAASQNSPLFGIGRALYFCIPRNTTLLAYWDTVADRLYKIRHGMNITGVVTPLPLFDPPIDPGMLVKAAAAGIDVGSIVSGLNQPVGPMRSLFLIQKALEIAGEVRSLGGALLSALEKGDAERLALLRQGHEINLQQMTQNVRFLQWKQAQESTQSLLRTRATALERYKYYLRLIGTAPDATTVPDTFTLDQRELTEDNFDEAYNALVGEYDQSVALQTLPQLKLAGNTSPSNQSGASGAGQLYLNTNEDVELNTHLPKARDTRLAANVVSTIAAVVTLIPEFDVKLAFWGLGAGSKIFGGSKLSDELKIGAEILQTIAGYEQDQAGMAARTAGYQRRTDDWMLQANLAARELMQIGRQIIGSLISEQVTYHEYTMAQTQVQQSQEVNTFLQTKFTNADFYGWMQSQLSGLYYQYYRFAVDAARKAEQTMKQELMRPELDDTDFIQYNYWDTGHQGLLSGEALHLDIKRMELAYHDNNKRELELTRHVSLRQLDPLALLKLKVTGSCTVSIPEWLYDRDCPGHYMRRIKSVAVSVPSVVGPYTSVNCTLTLQNSSVRTSSLLANGVYGRDTSHEDDRFQDYYGSVQTVVTSGANNDSGMFETNLRDDRFLPFEGAGAISTWTLELPAEFPAFDYMTISDVILHVRYTARVGGDLLGAQATLELQTAFAAAGQSRLALLFSLRYDFPTEWSAFVNAVANGSGSGASTTFSFTLLLEYFPYVVQCANPLTIDSLILYVQNGNQLAQKSQALPASPALSSTSTTLDLAFPTDTTVLSGDPTTQVFLVVQYHLGS
jgi:Tc toxin complex TcA C-terminal TcB-binding domain